MLRGVAGVVVLVVLATVAIFLAIDRIARTAIERGATYALGVETTLRDADVGVLSGEFSMNGLEVANAEGFDRDHFLRVGEGLVSVSLGSLRKDMVELPTLTLADINLVLEKKEGRSNYKVIAENLKKFESGGDGGGPADQEGGKEFVIREIVITDVNVEADVVGIGGQLNRVRVPIKLIRLENVGTGAGQGVGLGQLSDIIIKAILAAVVANAADFPADLISDLGPTLEGLAGLGEMGITETLGAAGSVVESLQGLGAAESAEEVTKGIEDVGKSVEDAAKELGDLFGKKKKDP